jgi:hypothetical protein
VSTGGGFLSGGGKIQFKQPLETKAALPVGELAMVLFRAFEEIL